MGTMLNMVGSHMPTLLALACEGDMQFPSQSGLGWDCERNMVMVESDKVWSRYVEVVNTKFYYVVTFST
jgi:hypothetical protein